MSVHPGSSGGELQLQPSPPPLISYELKMCEMCPLNFLRMIGAQDKHCRACRWKIAEEEREKERKRQERFARFS